MKVALYRRQEAEQRVIAAIREAGDNAYGFGLMRATGYRAGRLYSTLARLEAQGLITSRWEDQPADRPRRRLYSVAFLLLRGGVPLP